MLVFMAIFFTKTSSSLNQLLFVGKNTSAILPIEATQISEKHGQGKHTLSAFYLVLLKTWGGLLNKGWFSSPQNEKGSQCYLNVAGDFCCHLFLSKVSFFNGFRPSLGLVTSKQWRPWCFCREISRGGPAVSFRLGVCHEVGMPVERERVKNGSWRVKVVWS